MPGLIDNIIAIFEPAIGSAAGILTAMVNSLDTLSGAGGAA